MRWWQLGRDGIHEIIRRLELELGHVRTQCIACASTYADSEILSLALGRSVACILPTLKEKDDKQHTAQTDKQKKRRGLQHITVAMQTYETPETTNGIFCSIGTLELELSYSDTAYNVLKCTYATPEQAEDPKPDT